MMYSEFLKLANLTENDIPFDVYTHEIELAYREGQTGICEVVERQS